MADVRPGEAGEGGGCEARARARLGCLWPTKRTTLEVQRGPLTLQKDATFFKKDGNVYRYW